MERKTDTKALKKYMVDADCGTITKLAQASGLSNNTISHILSGKTQPSAEVMCKLIDTLKIPTSKAGQIFFSQ